MKVKDIERTANVAWSPKDQHPVYLAVGTAAQQLDASFSTSASLELYSLDVGEPGLDAKLVSNTSSDHRFHKLVWGSHNNTIVGGCDGGLIQLYDARKLLKGDEGMVGKQEKHTGPVHALDFNNFQHNLFASAAGNSEIFIWDLNNTTTPMSPGSKTQPLEDILSVSWNKQVQHILASTFPSKCVIWDLRKNEPIIKLTDTVSRIRWKVVTWHPEVATQLCLASEEDQSPVIQLWDLRFATSPLKTLEQHRRGVLSVSWCSDDPDLLVSCGKDNRILCLNPNSTAEHGEVLAEIAKTNQWSFDIVWCPRNPALIASPNFDGHVSVYSIMGGKTQQIETTDRIMDSFPGMDDYVQAPVPQQSTAPVSVDLAKPPRWFRRPVGARFGFGGKLVTFGHDKKTSSESVRRTVHISQVITDPVLVKKSEELEKALENENFIEYCLKKSQDISDQHKKYVWHFIKANFEQKPRLELLNLLGYNIEDVNGKLREHVGDESLTNDVIEDVAAKRVEDFAMNEPLQPKRKVSAPFEIKTGDDMEGVITQALLMNNVEAAVGLCLKAKRFADALVIATTGGDELLARTQHKYLEQSEGYVSSLISAVLSEDWSSLIENCDVKSWKEALTAILTHASDEELPFYCEQLGSKLEREGDVDRKFIDSAQLCYICAGSFDRLVSSWSDNIVLSTDSLQELVELVTFLRKAIERRGNRVQISGALAEFLSHYASLLASQGSLATAAAYLDSATDEKVVSLRDRLHIALGQKSNQVAPDTRHQIANRRGSHRPSISSSFPTASNLFGGTSTGFPLPNQHAQPEPFVGNPWQQPQPAVVQQPVDGGFNQPTRAFSPAPPARPPSVGSYGGGLPSRKYLLDPSVSYGTSQKPQQYQQQPQQYQQQPQQQFNPQTYNPNTFNNNNNVIAGPPSEPQEQAVMGGVSLPGWNDPPPISKPPKPQSKPEDPITHPLYGLVPEQPSLPPTNGYVDQSGQNYPQQTPGYAPQVYHPQVPNNNYAFNLGNSNQENRRQEVVNSRVESPKLPEKGPIPEEHIHLKTVFDELKNQCSVAANNPQTKRKLEDVGKKLESLYDMLRVNKLSGNTLSSLHQLVQLIQNGDYQGGLSLHTSLVSGPDFAQIASFMPGVKVLLQCAIQLQVYIR